MTILAIGGSRSISVAMGVASFPKVGPCAPENTNIVLPRACGDRALDLPPRRDNLSATYIAS